MYFKLIKEKTKTMNKKELQKISLYDDEKFQQYLYEENLEKLHNLKIKLDDIYYNTDQPTILSDAQYDLLKDVLISRDPDYVVPVGTVIRDNENRVKLPVWLGSMDKISIQNTAYNIFHKIRLTELKKKRKKISSEEKKTFNRKIEAEWKEVKENNEEHKKWIVIAHKKYTEELNRWKRKNNSPNEYIIQDKLDGVSCLCVINDGRIKLYTRGDGVYGSDISYLAQYFSTIPKNLPVNIMVRGELIMKKEIFESKYSQDFANARNMVAGRVGVKTIRPGLKNIDFVAYEIIGEIDEKMISPSKQFEILNKLGFSVVNHKIVDNITIESLSETLLEFKEISQYEIDGIIIQPNKPYIRNLDGNPKYSIAFKMRFSENLVETKVVQVLWNVSKWGQLKPRIQIEPVKLSGVTINYATGFNAKFIVDNNIGPGAIVQITRSGDVIPFITDVLQGSEDGPEMPNIDYSWNETKVDIFKEGFDNTMCIKLISNFFSKIGVKYVGEKIITKIYNAGFDTVLKIISASVDDFKNTVKLGNVLSEKVHRNIHSKLQNMSLSVILGASGVFGHGIGVRMTKVLFRQIPNILELNEEMEKKELISLVQEVDGFALKNAKKIVNNLPWAIKFVDELKLHGTFAEEQTEEKNDLAGLIIVFTGFRNKNMKEQIENRGGKVNTSVSGKTTLVVIKDEKSRKSKKVLKAQDLNIEIITKDEFIRRYSINES